MVLCELDRWRGGCLSTVGTVERRAGAVRRGLSTIMWLSELYLVWRRGLELVWDVDAYAEGMGILTDSEVVCVVEKDLRG